MSIKLNYGVVGGGCQFGVMWSCHQYHCCVSSWHIIFTICAYPKKLLVFYHLVPFYFFLYTAWLLRLIKRMNVIHKVIYYSKTHVGGVGFGMFLFLQPTLSFFKYK
ncbi:hypothetical protein Ancab_014616 [Ancistrocladus abbreviatus]